MGQYFGYIFFIIFVNFFRLTPFWLLYAFSDFLYYVIKYVVGYRKAVIYGNLKRCFPEKNPKEIEKITSDFYRHFCDITVESLKGFTLSKKELMKRLVLKNVDEVVMPYFEKGVNCIVAPAHYNNWEYPALVGGLYLPYHAVMLYKPLSNKLIDAYFREKRSSWGAEFWSIYETKKLFETTFEKPYGAVMAADQSPTNLNKAYWVNFFNIETAFLHGPEFYAKQNNMVIFYADIQKEKRGHYVGYFSLLAEPPKSDAIDGDITQKYASKLEEVIRKNPQYWLWSHNRWKHSKPSANVKD
jgi:KDO2-lipid IV(A) lauroyltransferase